MRQAGVLALLDKTTQGDELVATIRQFVTNHQSSTNSTAGQ
jgi:hypothetical protein